MAGQNGRSRSQAEARIEVVGVGFVDPENTDDVDVDQEADVHHGLRQEEEGRGAGDQNSYRNGRVTW